VGKIAKKQSKGVRFFNSAFKIQCHSQKYTPTDSVGFIFLNERAMEQTSIKKRRIFTLIGTVMVGVFFSLILSVFRSKYHGYPYR